MPLFPPVPELTVQATTGTIGYTLVNGTGNIITWTAPNDGAMHRVLLLCELVVSSTETGGKIAATFTDPGGTAHSQMQIYASALAGGTYGLPAASSPVSVLIQANTTYTLAQTAALTGGAAILWAEIWGS